MKPEDYARHVRKVHLDLHLPESLDGMFAQFDPRQYMETLARANVNSVALFAHCHHGNCYFNTQVGHKHKHLHVDYLGELAREAKKHDIVVLAYFSVAWNWRGREMDPDWCQVDVDGNPLETKTYWIRMCLNSPYRDYIFSMVREVIASCPVDGIWFDITYMSALGCYCPSCQQQFQDRYGKPLPRKPVPGTLGAREMYEFHRHSEDRFRLDAVELVKGINPELLVSWNHAGDMNQCQLASDDAADILFRETHRPEDYSPSFQARWFGQFGKPYEGCTSRFHYGGWSDFTYKHASKLRIEAATALAHGAVIDIGDQGMPDGTLDPHTYAMIGQVYAEARRVEPFCMGTRSVRNIAVLHSSRAHRLGAWLFTEPLHKTLPSVLGASRMLTEAHRHFDIISERCLDDLAGYAAVVVPDQIHLAPEDVTALQAYVESGGTLVVSYRAGLFDEDGKPTQQGFLRKVCGVAVNGLARFSADYIVDYDMDLGLDGRPVLVRSPKDSDDEIVIPSLECERVDGDAWAWLAHPVFERTPDHFFAGNNAPPGERSPFPALVHRSLGRGHVVYTPIPIFKHYHEDSYYPLRRLIVWALDQAAPDQAVYADAPTQVELVLRQRDDMLLVHLVNYSGARFGSKPTPMPVEDIVPVRDVRVRVRAQATRVTLVPDDTPLVFEQDGPYTTFRVPELDVHAIAAVQM